jgi:hypothetical protein
MHNEDIGSAADVVSLSVGCSVGVADGARAVGGHGHHAHASPVWPSCDGLDNRLDVRLCHEHRHWPACVPRFHTLDVDAFGAVPVDASTMPCVGGGFVKDVCVCVCVCLRASACARSSFGQTSTAVTSKAFCSTHGHVALSLQPTHRSAAPGGLLAALKCDSEPKLETRVTVEGDIQWRSRSTSWQHLARSAGADSDSRRQLPAARNDGFAMGEW